MTGAVERPHQGFNRSQFGWSGVAEKPSKVAAADPESYDEHFRFVVAIDEMPEGVVPDRPSHQDLGPDRVTSQKSWLDPGSRVQGN